MYEHSHQSTAIPEKVANRAARQNMGALLSTGSGTKPGLKIALAIAAAVIVVALLNAADMRVPTARFAAFAVIVGAPFYVIHALITGSRKTFLFRGGLVQATNVTVKRITWPEVKQLEIKQADEDAISGVGTPTYVLHRDGGGTISVDGGTDLAGRLADQVRRAGRPVGA